MIVKVLVSDLRSDGGEVTTWLFYGNMNCLLTTICKLEQVQDTFRKSQYRLLWYLIGNSYYHWKVILVVLLLAAAGLIIMTKIS